MRTIYQPAGRAREYSPLALNIYSSCEHGCKYCYANRLAQMRGDKDYYRKATPRPGVAEALAKELEKSRPAEQVLLSFIGDCYGPSTDNHRATTQAVRLLSMHNVPFAVLTKSTAVLDDIDIFRHANCMVGMTLTFASADKSRAEEPMAALPDERIDTLRKLHEAGIKTFASFEPVIEEGESLAIMDMALPYVDLFKLGKLNGDARAKNTNWASFLNRSLTILRSQGKEIYVKNDLRDAAKEVFITAEESNADLHCVRSVEPSTAFF